MDFYTPRNIGPADQILFDSDGNAVGIQPAASSSPPVLGFNPKKHAAIESLVSGYGVPKTLYLGSNLVRTADGTANDAVDVTMASFTLPGGTLKSNGMLLTIVSMTGIASSQDKTLSLWVGGQTLGSPPITSTNTRATAIIPANANGSATLECGNQGLNPFGQTTGAIISRSIDLTVDQPVLLTLKWAAAVTAGNTWRIMNATVLAFPGSV